MAGTLNVDPESPFSQEEYYFLVLIHGEMNETTRLATFFPLPPHGTPARFSGVMSPHEADEVLFYWNPESEVSGGPGQPHRVGSLSSKHW